MSSAMEKAEGMYGKLEIVPKPRLQALVGRW